MTDEGRRWLNITGCPVKWCNLKRMPFIGLHLYANLSPPLISFALLSSFPPGEAKGLRRFAGC